MYACVIDGVNPSGNYYDLLLEWNKSLGENCLYVEVLDKKQVKQKAKGF